MVGTVLHRNKNDAGSNAARMTTKGDAADEESAEQTVVFQCLLQLRS